MSAPRFPLRAAAALFLERQQLDRPRARRLTPASAVSLVRGVGGLQLDSINVVDRAHRITLWSRFGPHDRDRFDRIVYHRRLLFEYWAHAACIVPTEDFPAWRRPMLDYHTRNRAWSKFLRKHGPMLKKVEAAIRERGPLGSADFDQPQKKRSAGWWNWKPAAHALDFLWMSGVITSHSRKHFQKRFDLTERLLPDALARPPFSREKFFDWHLDRSLDAMGAATETDLSRYMTFPRHSTNDRRAALKKALRAGTVVEVAIEGIARRWFVRQGDLEALERAARRRAASRGTTFLSPFDSFLWHRERTERLFGFDYTIEVYVPSHKRRFGYYSLPILHDGQLIGRADLKTHRAESRLELKAVHFEPWFARGEPPPAARWQAVDRDAALAGVAEAARSLAAFVGAREVTLGAVAPRALRAPLARALAHAPALHALDAPIEDDAEQTDAEPAEI
ncbi:MAG TPA: crosslink repair DNA glycosylase YcaQ family protein [Candidatus Sulfotelmatobacter sp.]|nr:crosslink repair DNA glycosylase YcaQ family protein [Candidatus Sulfotelmatobacter sp.]